MSRLRTSHTQGRALAKALLAVVLASAALLPISQAEAETRREYVHRYVLLLDWVTRSEVWVTSHLNDLGLCRLAHSVSERQVELAQRMTPPAEYTAIHPHFLIVLENAERMFDFAASGDREGFRRHRRIVHEEQRLIAEMLQAEGRYMPTITP